MELLSRELRTLLDDVASAEPDPGAGAVAGLVTALAAGLVCSAARRSPEWPEARATSAQAEALRHRVQRLAEANAQAYVDAVALLERPEGGDAHIGKALDTAAELPLAIAEAAYDVVLLAVEASQHVRPPAADDAAAAALLAEAAARAAASFVAVNLVSTPGDARVAHAEGLAAAATAAARRAVATTE